MTGLSIDVIKNQIRLSKMFAGSEAVSTKALKELLEYKETGLTPQDIKDMDNYSGHNMYLCGKRDGFNECVKMLKENLESISEEQGHES